MAGRPIWMIRLLFFMLVTIKGFDRLIYASIWAEDGKVFLKQAIEIGWSSLFIPYDGYFHTLPRLIALTATHLPATLIPHFIVLVCYAIVAYAITLVFSASYTWLFRNRTLSTVCAILLLLLPGQGIILGNTANLHWYLLLILALLGLKDITKPYTIPELIIAFLCISSEGAVIILLPLFLTRMALIESKTLQRLCGEIIIAGLIVAFAGLHLSIPGEAHEYASVSSYFQILVSQFCYFFMLHIFVGDSIVRVISGNEKILRLLAFLTLSALLYILRRVWQKELTLVLVLSLCGLLLPIMIALARPQNIELMDTYFSFDSVRWFRFRYSFFVPAIASIFWISLISRMTSPRWLPDFLVAVILFTQIFLNGYRIPINRYKEISDWYDKAPLLEKSWRQGCPERVLVHINPPPWTVEFRSPVKSDCD